MNDLSIIVVNFNTPKLVYGCIESIEKWVTISYQLILVDNGSAECLSSALLPKESLYIPLKENRGFGAGNNAGAAKATGKYLWLLNSDTLLTDASAGLLINFLDTHSDIGIVSPYLYNGKQLQPGFYASFQSLSTVLLRRTRPALQPKNTYQQVDLVVGAALMIRRSLFETLKGFDEHFFMYLEDDDLCMRAKKTGFSTAILPSAQVLHLQGQSISKSKTRKNFYYASQSYFWRKHYGPIAELLLRILRSPYRLLRNGR